MGKLVELFHQSIPPEKLEDHFKDIMQQQALAIASLRVKLTLAEQQLKSMERFAEKIKSL